MAAVFVIFAIQARQKTGENSAGVLTAVAAAILAFAVPTVLPAIGIGARDNAQIAATDSAWVPFDLAAIPTLVSDGKVVFVDVTADWCITCQVNKKRVLDTADIVAAFEQGEVVRMRADWTKPSNEIANYLASFGRFGIPFNVIYGPDAPQGVILPELLSDDSVYDGLASAGITNAVAAR
jgi:suppressor for copper-sensitivity B